MDADYCEDTVETFVPGKKRKHMSKFKRIIKKKKPKFDPGMYRILFNISDAQNLVILAANLL